MIGRGNLLTSISFPSQDSGTLTCRDGRPLRMERTDAQVGGGR